MLLQYINSAQTNYKAPAKPERNYRPIFVMQINQELMQTSTVHNIWKITISEKRITFDKTINYTWKNQKKAIVDYELTVLRDETKSTLTSNYWKIQNSIIVDFLLSIVVIYLDMDLSDILEFIALQSKLQR